VALDVAPIQLQTLRVVRGRLAKPLRVAGDPQVEVLDPDPVQALGECRLGEPGLVRPCRLADVEHDLDPVFKEEVQILIERALLVADRTECHAGSNGESGSGSILTLWTVIQ
jgi:hypothetical protein